VVSLLSLVALLGIQSHQALDCALFEPVFILQRQDYPEMNYHVLMHSSGAVRCGSPSTFVMPPEFLTRAIGADFDRFHKWKIETIVVRIISLPRRPLDNSMIDTLRTLRQIHAPNAVLILLVD
jgi:hypothetical protein